jgi:hypothetical protein
MAPIRGQRVQQKGINESSILPFVRATGKNYMIVCVLLYNTHPFSAPHIGSYYSQFVDHLRPLSNCTSVPDDLIAVSQFNGDISLRTPGGEEATFDVIAVNIDSCLEAPPGFSKCVHIFFFHK